MPGTPDATSDRRKLAIVLALGSCQTLAWGSSYYIAAIIADPISRELSMSTTSVFAAFSVSLLLAAVLGPRIGRTIDRFGGREVLAASNVIFAVGLGLIAIAPNTAVIWLGWLVLGLGMGLGLYDAAFATLGRIFGDSARSAITGITLLGGLASTVAWPLTAWGVGTIGWRDTCLCWAAAHLLLGLPLNMLVLPKLRGTGAALLAGPKPHIPMDREMWLLGIAFACGWLVAAGMGAHLPRILEAAGATTAGAVAAAALFGPGQVAARIVEASLFRNFHPLVSARLSTVAHPLGAGLLLFGGPWLAVPCSIMHGAGNGILTIARGTVPLAVFGSENYGYRLGILGAPARIAQAGAPLAFGLLLDRYGAGVLYASSGLCFVALACFLLVKARVHQQAVTEMAAWPAAGPSAVSEGDGIGEPPAASGQAAPLLLDAEDRAPGADEADTTRSTLTQQAGDPGTASPLPPSAPGEPRA